MIEKTDILDYLVTQLAAVSGVAHVSQNAWKDVSGRAGECPAIFLMDMGDEPVDESSISAKPKIHKWMNVAIVSVVQGSTEADAASELEAFQRLTKAAIYANGRSVGTTYKGNIFEVRTSPVFYHKSGNRIVFQRVDYRILYVEDIARLFE